MGWNDLSTFSKARIMQLAVNSGITDLRAIRDAYNSYEEGGKKQSLKEKLTSKVKDAAYKISTQDGVMAKGNASLVDIAKALLSKKDDTTVDDNKYAYIYGTGDRYPEVKESIQGFDYSNYLNQSGYRGIKDVYGTINPYKEYHLDSKYKPLLEELAKHKYHFYDNADDLFVDIALDDIGYRDDVANFIHTLGTDDKGNVMVHDSDVYDFNPSDYNYTRGLIKPITKLEAALMNKVGTPYIIRQENQPVYYDGTNGVSTNIASHLDNLTDEDIAKITGSGLLKESSVVGRKFKYGGEKLRNEFNAQNNFSPSGTLLHKFEEGGKESKDESKYIWDPGTQVSPQIESAVNYIPMKFTKLIKLKNGVVAGISDITEDIKSGQPLLYNRDFGLYNKRLGLRERFYKNKSNDDIFMVNPEYINSPLDPETYTEISLEDVRKMLPKRDYIGGDNYRINTAMKIPGFTDKIYERAAAYGVDPNLMLHRILKEGYIDSLVKEYNNGSVANQKDFFSSLWDRYINGFEQFGLDDAGTHLLEGKYELLDPNAKWREFEALNEQGRPVTSVTTDDLSSAIEILAAEMAYRQNELKKRGITPSDLGIYTNAAFNMGLYNDKLKDSAFVKKNYSYEPYYTKYKLMKKQ